MNWIEFKNITKIDIGFVITKQSGVLCPISRINDSNESFSYLINGNTSKTIYLEWINKCIDIVKTEHYISNSRILSICNASCDVAIVSSMIVNQLKIAKYTVPIGKKRSLGLTLL